MTLPYTGVFNMNAYACCGVGSESIYWLPRFYFLEAYANPPNIASANKIHSATMTQKIVLSCGPVEVVVVVVSVDADVVGAAVHVPPGQHPGSHA